MDPETEKLKYAVINMHFSALLLCAVCWPVVFWTDENILKMGIPLLLSTGILSVYNFVRQTVFLSRYPHYRKSKKRFLFDTVAYSCCVCLAPIVGSVELFHRFYSWQIAAFLSLKLYYVLFVAVTMSILMDSAHRLNKIWVKAAKAEEAERDTRESERGERVYALWGTFFVGTGSIAVLFVGVGNLLYCFFCLPILVASAVFFFLYFIQGARSGYFGQIKLWKPIVGTLCAVTLAVVSHLFTHASTVVEYEKINVAFEIYTFVILPDILLLAAAFLLFYRNAPMKADNG